MKIRSVYTAGYGLFHTYFRVWFMLIIEDVTVNMKGKATKIAGRKVINLGQVVCLNANVNIGLRRRHKLASCTLYRRANKSAVALL